MCTTSKDSCFRQSGLVAVKRGSTKPAARIAARATGRGAKTTSSQSQAQLQVYRPFTVSLSHPTAGQRTVLTTHAGTVVRQFNLTARMGRVWAYAE